MFSRPMSPRWRVALALIGLVLIVLSVLALTYALWPTDSVRDQQRLDPTLFSPPQSWLWPGFDSWTEANTDIPGTLKNLKPLNTLTQ